MNGFPISTECVGEQIKHNKHCSTLNKRIMAFSPHPQLSWSSGQVCPHKEPGQVPPTWKHRPDWPPPLPRTLCASGSHYQTAGSESAEDNCTVIILPSEKTQMLLVGWHIIFEDIWRKQNSGWSFSVVTRGLFKCIRYTSDWHWYETT